MYHGHHDMGGSNFETAAFFSLWFLGSLFVAYYAMKFAVLRREARERKKP